VADQRDEYQQDKENDEKRDEIFHASQLVEEQDFPLKRRMLDRNVSGLGELLVASLPDYTPVLARGKTKFALEHGSEPEGVASGIRRRRYITQPRVSA